MVVLTGTPVTARDPRDRYAVLARIAVLYVAARIVTTVMLMIAAELSGPQSRFGSDATIASFVVGWDARWYGVIAAIGYPAELPLTDSGAVAENAWAFMPLYAYLALAVGAPWGSWPLGALVVSLVAGYLACVALYALLRVRLDAVAATWAVVFFAAGPLGALFQVGYAEPLFLLWLFLALWCVLRRRYAWLYLLIPLMGYTRPGVLAFALLLGLHGVARWIARRRDPLPVRHIVHIVALGLLATAVGFSWPVIAAAVTGRPDAYFATELAWRRNWLGGGDAGFVPFEGVWHAAAFWFERWGLSAGAGRVAVAITVVLVAAALIADPRVKRLGVDLRLWSASYLVYLLAVFFPQSSTFRLLLPLSPLWGAVAVPRSPLWRSGVLASCLLLQWWWIFHMYAQGSVYWQVP